jgi:hypothetical protein
MVEGVSESRLFQLVLGKCILCCKLRFSTCFGNLPSRYNYIFARRDLSRPLPKVPSWSLTSTFTLLFDYCSFASSWLLSITACTACGDLWRSHCIFPILFIQLKTLASGWPHLSIRSACPSCTRVLGLCRWLRRQLPIMLRHLLTRRRKA